MSRGQRCNNVAVRTSSDVKKLQSLSVMRVQSRSLRSKELAGKGVCWDTNESCTQAAFIATSGELIAFEFEI